MRPEQGAKKSRNYAQVEVFLPLGQGLQPIHHTSIVAVGRGSDEP